MSMEGTLADPLTLRILIVESEATNMLQNPRSVYLGHIGEMHYLNSSSFI